jgi:SAM-dependent methyltransferase
VTRQNGAVRIFLYNWPVYAGTWIFAALLLALSPRLEGSATWAAWVVALGAVAWSLASLLVSYYIYERSPLAAGQWVPRFLGSSIGGWASVHAGLDAEVELDAVMPGACVARLDIFDPRVMTSPSIARARARTPPSKQASPCSPTALALSTGACDAIVVAFTAHEIRDRGAREAFFGELCRSLRPGGKVLLVEHLRDVANFLAFGPGYLHFVARREWLRLASHAGLAVSAETRITPWVMALALERPR